jgi:predicted TIM-barrel fold metal-dependent hydrolase
MVKEDNAMLTRRGMLGQVAAGGAWALGSGVAAAAIGGTATNFPIPRGACDCHVHVFGAAAQFPFAERRTYTPPPASVEQLLELQRDLHMDRVVVVQPSVYGTDNACTMDGVKRMGSRARGIVVIDKSTPRAALQEMASAGARGIRLNLNTAGVFDPNTAKQQLDTVAEQLRGLNWHVQMFVALSVISALTDYFKQYPYPVVFDHFGQPKAPEGVGQPGFANLLDLVKSGHAYVKISGAYRVSTQPPAYADATPLAQALVAANPDRIVWGTDWPHPNGASARSINEIATPFPIDDGLLLNELPKWVPDAATRKKILVDNPARLYGFEPVAG